MGQNYGIPCKYVWQPRTDPNLGEPNRALSLAPRPWFSKSQGEPGGWSRRRESNPHGTKYHWILSPARLPVPPLRVKNYSTAPSCTQAGLTREVKFSSFLFPSPSALLLRFLPRVAAGVMIRRWFPAPASFPQVGWTTASPRGTLSPLRQGLRSRGVRRNSFRT